MLAWELSKTDTDLCLAPALPGPAGPHTSIRAAAAPPLHCLDYRARHTIKNLSDRLAAAAALILLLPVLIAIAAAVKLGDRGPVFFRQVRVGRNGHPFQIFKFRTMVTGADNQRALLQQHSEHSNSILFKIKDDPRITKVGTLLRRYSLDELPQILNVLLGQMSLVGPRPALPEEVARYDNHAHRRLAVQPGMTGLWQISGRSDLSWEDSIQLDLRYVETWSLTLDLQILCKTWPAVIHGKGAYLVSVW
jgi:exopolysaccharide biosynthesis polyprenyl glycosylphosphotransferase